MDQHDLNVITSRTKPETAGWETPPELFSVLDAEFAFDVDVAAEAHNTKLPDYFGPDHVDEKKRDALLIPWAPLSCWVNPPYDEIEAWLRKAVREADDGARVVVLVPSRTETRWWNRYVTEADEIRFLHGRLRFVGAEHTAPFPSVIVIFDGRRPIRGPLRVVPSWEWRKGSRGRAYKELGQSA